MVRPLLIDVDDPRWSAFVAARPEATPFHHPLWTRLLADCYGFEPLVFAIEDEQIVAGTPALEVRSLRGRRRWVALPFTDVLPPLGSASDVSNLAVALETRVDAGNVHAVEIHAELTAGHKSIRGSRHVLRLRANPDEVLHTFSKTVPQDIARAERDGVVVRVGEHRDDLVEVFYRLHLQTRRRLGVPVQPRRFFSLLWERMLEPGFGWVLIAELEQTPVAAAVFLSWNGTVVYKFSASDRAALRARPNHAVLWEAIKRACVAGANEFDFGRTDVGHEGLRSFKAGWGTEERSLRYTTLGAQSPSEGSARLRSSLAAVIRHSPAWVCRFLGESLYRYAA